MKKIPRYAANRALHAAKNDILSFYENPENVKEFEEWKKARAKRKQNKIVPYVGKEGMENEGVDDVQGYHGKIHNSDAAVL